MFRPSCGENHIINTLNSINRFSDLQNYSYKLINVRLQPVKGGELTFGKITETDTGPLQYVAKDSICAELYVYMEVCVRVFKEGSQ